MPLVLYWCAAICGKCTFVTTFILVWEIFVVSLNSISPGISQYIKYLCLGTPLWLQWQHLQAICNEQVQLCLLHAQVVQTHSLHNVVLTPVMFLQTPNFKKLPMQSSEGHPLLKWLTKWVAWSYIFLWPIKGMLKTLHCWTLPLYWDKLLL